MAEIGATPKVPRLQRAVLRAVRTFSTPLLPDDYLELINPLWSTRELRGRIERIDHVTGNAATVMIKPGYRWEGHEAGQYCRIGVDIRGVRHWRAYSLTSEPDRPDGCISITPKLVEGGVVSPYLVGRGRPGAIVSLGGVEGDFVLPDPLPEKLLFISAGSGITPIISMLRSLSRHHAMNDVVLLHSARDPDDVIFGGELRHMAEVFDGFRLHEQHTKTMGRMAPEHLDELCPDCGKACSSICTWSASSRRSAAARPAKGERSSSSKATARSRPTAPSQSSSKARRPASSFRSDAVRASATHVSGRCAKDAFATCATDRFVASKARR